MNFRSEFPSRRERRMALGFGLLVLALGPVPASATISAEASLSGTQILAGEPFQLNVQVSTDKKEELPWPQIQGLEPFQVAKNSSTTAGSQTTVVNGRINQSSYYITTFTYTLTAKQPGTYAIGPIRYTHKDYNQELGSANVVVTRAEAGLTTQAMLSKARAYVGEQVLYTLRIIPKAGVQSINLPEDLQKLIGEKFFFQRLEKNVSPKAVTLGGQQVKVFDIHIALYPLLEGTAGLEGIPVEYQQVRRAQRRQTGSVFDLFDDDFFGGARVVNQKAMAEPLRMEVLALPGGAPAGFNGSVGEYSLTAAADRPSVAAGDAVTLTVTIRGNGQPKSITKPALPDLSAFEVFDPEETSSTALAGSTLWATKTFKYVIIPRRPGTYSLDGISFAYFDPKKGAYARAAAGPISIQVGPGKEGEAPQARLMTQREIAELGSDIRHIKTDAARLHDDGDLPYRHVWFGGLLLMSPLAFAGALLARRRRDRLRSDSAFLRRTQAGAAFQRRLKEARQAVAGQPRDFYRLLSQAIIGFASDHLNLEFRGMTLGEAKEILVRRGIKPETVKLYEYLLGRCDAEQFGVSAAKEADRRGDLAATETLFEQLEKELG